MVEVQAVVNNISFPKSLNEILQIHRIRNGFDIEILMKDSENGEYTEWTMPKWCKPGDIVFFMHAKTARATIAKLKKALQKSSEKFSSDESGILNASLERGIELYNQFGGKIFMIGKVCEEAFYDSDKDYEFNPHWKSKIYAPIDSLFQLQCPVDLSEFSSFIQLSRQSAITPVFGKEFDMLKSLIMSRNPVPFYLQESVSVSVPLSKISKDNWIQLTSKYRRSFFLEIQFRTYYVNYFLELIGDRKTFYRECACIKHGQRTSFVDNVIVVNGCYLPVEVKLNIDTEKNLIGQLQKYCSLDSLILDTKKNRYAAQDKIFNYGVLVIDTNGVYWYYCDAKSIEQIYDLDNLLSQQDILDLRKLIIDTMNSPRSILR